MLDDSCPICNKDLTKDVRKGILLSAEVVIKRRNTDGKQDPRTDDTGNL